MNNILHTLLGVDKSNPFFEILFDSETPNDLQIYYGMRLLETVPRNSFPEKLLIARLFNAGHNQKVLKETFKYDFKTMRSWGRLLKSGEIDNIKKIGEGQGAMKKLTDDKLRYIKYLYKVNQEIKGCHINKFIADEYFKIYDEKISTESIRLLFKAENDEEKSIELEEITPNDEAALIHEKEKIIQEKSDSSLKFNHQNNDDLSPNRENGFINDKELALININNPKLSPHQNIFEKDNFPIIDKKFNQIFSCHHIGLLLSRIFLDFVTAPLGDIKNITRQWITMILSGSQNIEQGQNLNYRVLELLIGKQKASPNKQRQRLLFRSNSYFKRRTCIF